MLLEKVKKSLQVSPSHRGRGLKYEAIGLQTHDQMSPSHRGRGLKYIDCGLCPIGKGRPLTEGVD